MSDSRAKSGGKRNSGTRPIFGGRNPRNAKMAPDLPAKMNRMYNGNEMSVSHTMTTFENAHGDSDTEHLIAYDDDGFVSTYTHGGRHSVGYLNSQVEGKHVIHNHPSGGHFSRPDMLGLSTSGKKV